MRRQGASAVQADALDRTGLLQVMAATAPDAVIHQLTALSDADGEATNRLRREGTRNLVDAAKSAGVGRIVAQSISWAYAPGEAPADETVPLDTGAAQPRGGMVDGIQALEETAAELETAVALRYGILYGPGTWYAPGGAVAAALAGDSTARLLAYLEADRSVTSFVHVADAARATVAALAWPSGPVNIVDDEPAAGARVAARPGRGSRRTHPGSHIRTAELGTGSVQHPGPLPRMATRTRDVAIRLRDTGCVVAAAEVGPRGRKHRSPRP